jgi:hypothetical protein
LYQVVNNNTHSHNSDSDLLRKENKDRNEGEVIDNRTNSIQQAVTSKILDKEIVEGDNSEVISNTSNSSHLTLNSNK